MIVVATEDFEIYHEVVTELRERGVSFTTIEPGGGLPAKTEVVIAGEEEHSSSQSGYTTIVARPGDPRQAVDEAIAALRGETGRTVVGIDPGEQPGIAVLVGDIVVATYQVPPAEVAAVVHEEVGDAPDPIVRIGDGARLIGARIIDELDVPVELVDEAGTTPYLGTGTRGIGDIIAAINIARLDGEVVQTRDVEPTAGELQRIQDRSREQSDENRAIDADLARQVAAGDLTIREALDEHQESTE